MEQNIVLFELRFHGRGSSAEDDMAAVDFGVHAADIAFAMEALQLPPSHFYCPSVSAFHTGIHLGILFPDVVLSLSFACVYALFRTDVRAKRVFADFDSYIREAELREDYIEGIAGLGQSCLSILVVRCASRSQLTATPLALRSRDVLGRSEPSAGRGDRHCRGDVRACE